MSSDDNIKIEIKPQGVLKKGNKEFPVFYVFGDPVKYLSFNELDGAILNGIDNVKLTVVKGEDVAELYIRESFDIIYLSSDPIEDDHHEMHIRESVRDELMGKRLIVKRKGYYREEGLEKDLPGFVVIGTEGTDRLYQIAGDDGFIFIDRYPVVSAMSPFMTTAAYEKMFCKHIVDMDDTLLTNL